MVVHAHGVPLEMVGTVMEMADIAWNAIEHRRERAAHETAEEEELEKLRSENLRLREVLEENVSLLQGLSQDPSLAKDCPTDLYTRLVAAVDSSSFLNKLEELHHESAEMSDGSFPFRKATGEDLNAVEILINVGREEPSCWLWVTHEMLPDDLEEASGIDNESYVILTEDNVVDGIANFIAKCIIANPKSKTLTPVELQKSVTRALGGIKGWSTWKKVWEATKIIYALSTWGIALAGLYRHRAVLKIAAKGVHHTGKLVMKAL